MLHELLLCLFGRTGSLFLESDDAFILSPSLRFLTPSESDLLLQIARLGYLYKQILRFQQAYGGINTKLAIQMAYDTKEEDKEE